MKRRAETTPDSRSWRVIQQQAAPQSVTTISSRRRNHAMLRNTAIIVILCACAWGAFEIYLAWYNNPAGLQAPVKSEPLQSITLENPNGVLDRAWVERTLALPKGIGMMELDLFALRDRLLATPQIRSATLTRQLPATLAIVLEERSPVARIFVQYASGKRDDLLVSNDGAIFAGENFKQDMLASLPYLADVPLRPAAPDSPRFAPLDAGCMESLARLITIARINIPNLYASWKWISLKRYDEDRVFVVNIAGGSQVIFGTRDTFDTQVARLDYIMDNIGPVAASRGQLRMIDLSVGLTPSGVQVPVTFDPPPEPAPRAGANRRAAAQNTVIFRP